MQFAPTYNEYVLYNHNEGDNAQTKYPLGSTAPSGQGVELAGITVVASNSPVTSSVSSNQADQEETMTTNQGQSWSSWRALRSHRIAWCGFV
jgi:hypothetical protein